VCSGAAVAVTTLLYVRTLRRGAGPSRSSPPANSRPRPRSSAHGHRASAGPRRARPGARGRQRLAEYLPPAKIAAILGHPLDEPGFRRDWFEKVTARHVLSHSGGFPHGESGSPFPLAFEPGTQWKYSADGYFYLQRVVEHLKGGTLDALMRKEVLEPLGMTRSAMVWKPGFEPVMASGHGLLGRPEAARRRMEAHAGASLYTTAGDYARFLCAVLNGEGLQPAMLNEMIAPRIGMGASKILGWSLGFGTQSDANGLALWQWGDDGIFRNYAIAYPGSRTGVVYLTNSFYGLGVASALVARSVGGQTLGAAALNYRPYDSPLYRFVWDVQEKGPAAVNGLDRLRRGHPGLVERDRIGFVASSFMDAGMLPQALALLESDLRDHPRSGKAAVAVAEACVKTGPIAWTGGELAFTFTIPLEGGMDIRTRLTAQGATLKGRWEDVKGGNSGPVEMALAPRRP